MEKIFKCDFEITNWRSHLHVNPQVLSDAIKLLPNEECHWSRLPIYACTISYIYVAFERVTNVLKLSPEHWDK